VLALLGAIYGEAHSGRVEDPLSDVLAKREEAEEAKKRRDARKDWTPQDWLKANREAAAARGLAIKDDHD
jgi:hypothetical protein